MTNRPSIKLAGMISTSKQAKAHRVPCFLKEHRGSLVIAATSSKQPNSVKYARSKIIAIIALDKCMDPVKCSVINQWI